MEELTSKLAQYLSGAHDLALRKDHSSFGPEHVLSVMSEDKENNVLDNLARMSGLESGQLSARLAKEVDGQPKVAEHDGVVSPSRDLVAVLNLAKKEADRQQDSHVSTDSFLMACAQKKSKARELLTRLGIDPQKVGEVVQKARAGERVTGSGDEEQRGALAKYTIDLTAAARAGEIDPVIGRDDEIRRAMQILQRRTKNNPVLIGDPGVGKTAIVEGLAQRIADGEVPETLSNKSLLVLDLAGMLAGAKYRGEFEERFKAVLKEISKNKDRYIIFIDELHTLVGAGASEGAVDAANMIKPALARGEWRCIGATTLDEYRKHVEKDAALERRFQRLLVQEPDKAAAVSMLRGLVDRYILHHGVRITDRALVAAVELSSRYISDRYLPDKAIDLIDEAAAKLRIERDSKPEAIDRLDRAISQLKIDEAAVKGEEDEASKGRLEDIRARIGEAEKELADLTDTWRKEKAQGQEAKENKEEIERMTRRIDALTKDGKYEEAAQYQHVELPKLKRRASELEHTSGDSLLPLVVDEREIAVVVSRATGIPVSRMMGTEKDRLLGMADRLRARVVSQDRAVGSVTDAVLRARTGMADPDKPSGCFMFLGPTGVGKTELAKSLAEFLFDSERYLVRIDMSEYMERHAVSRLIGAPPGYVGYDAGGQLTEVVRRRPYCVVLFDEIEKAHPEVFNVLLQVLDDGRLTDGQGRTVDFRNTVLVMTSNIGSQLIAEGAEDARDKAMDEVRLRFRPEFLNRLDEIVFFDPLDDKALESIARLQLQLLGRRLADEGMELAFTDAAVSLLSQIDGDKAYGARPIKRALQRHVETPLSRMIIEDECGPGSKVEIDARSGRFSFRKGKSEAGEKTTAAPKK